MVCHGMDVIIGMSLCVLYVITCASLHLIACYCMYVIIGIVCHFKCLCVRVYVCV